MPSLGEPHPSGVRVARVSQTAYYYDAPFIESWDRLLVFDSVNHKHTIECGSLFVRASPRLGAVRSEQVMTVLASPNYEADWFFGIDADMGFPEDALCRLLGVAYGGDANRKIDDPVYDMVGGLCFAGGHHEAKPTVYGAVRDENGSGVSIHFDYPEDAIVEVAGTGAAFFIVSRRALLHMMQDHPVGFGTFPDGSRNPTPWFVEGQHNGREFGEDIAFCQRLRALGYKIAVDTRLKIDHWKHFPLNEEIYKARRTAEEYSTDPDEQTFLLHALHEYRRRRPTVTDTVGPSRAERRRLERELRKGAGSEHSR